ncbi:MAG TPA: HAD-IG family 5'-nucleotidase [Polyangia bacterium]|nr:HAD-IG family 5'-nucleotidase [Polyangia bacterium]
MVADPSKAHPTLKEDASKAHLELLEALGQSVPRSLDIPRARRIFVNRNLRMDEIELIGFDMDYTLALYHQRNLEALSIQCTLDKLIAKRGYPEEIRALDFDPAFAVRGLVVDRRFGNIFKADRYGHVGRVYHGRTTMSREERHQLYRLERIRLSSPRYAWIDTLFALPEAVMYSAMIDFFERKGGTVRFGKIWQDIRECIDEAHRDESMKRIIKANLGDYIVKDPELAPTLHKFRSSGKRLFLLTNSAWDYTEAVMTHLLNDALPAYANWRSYFDVVIVAGSKPAFFTDKHPFVEIDASGNVKAPHHTGPFVRNRIYQGGNIHDFTEAVGVRGDHVLYIGDHIYGDMLRAKKSSVWRTAMILQELEAELTAVENNKERLERVEQLERQCVRLDSEISYQQVLLKSLQKIAEGGAAGAPASNDAAHEPLAHAQPTVDAAKHEAKRRLDELRAALKAAAEEISENDNVIDRAFNPYWGAIFREAAENSRFGQQVEDYACVYTSRVSNFLAYSPLRYFRSPRDHMPHELV